MSSPFRDTEVYCARCQEPLELAGGRRECPCCRQWVDTDDPATYRTERARSALRYWMPAFCLAVGSGVVAYVACLQQGNMGMGLFVGVPLSVGAILGYRLEPRSWSYGCLALLASVAVVCGLLCGGFAGMFCGLTLVLIFLLPTLGGLVLGYGLACLLKFTSWDQRWFLPTVLLMAIPYAIHAWENCLPRVVETEVVRTSLHVHATPAEAWKAVVFYEEVEHSPPWLLRLALPRPLRSEGDKRREGEIVRCYYDRGWLNKRILRVEPQRRIAFEVVEQKLHFERDIQLQGGEFRFEPVQGGGTRITLTTSYRRKLAPRWLWLPIERHVVRSLHQHVLEGMRRRLQSPPAPPQSDRPYRPPPRPRGGKQAAATEPRHALAIEEKPL